jgi:hypothetical protein
LFAGTKDVTEDIHESVAVFRRDSEVDGKKKKNSHSLSYLFSEAYKELKRDPSYLVVFLASAGDKMVLLALSTYNNLIF